MKTVAGSFFSAVSFLTFIPIPSVFRGGEKALARSPYFFPIVGVFLGGVVVLIDFAQIRLFNSAYLGSSIAVLSMIGMSKALHLDGLADSADGFLSSRPRPKALEIMRDSRIGSAGAMAIVAVILLKWSALMSVPDSVRWQTLLLMPLCGRCALLFQMSLLPYARKEGGLASIFLGCKRPLMLAMSLLTVGGVGFYVLSFSGLLIAASSFAFTALFSLYCYRRIGGFTGDTLGAACEIIELVPPCVMVACEGQCFTV